MLPPLPVAPPPEERKRKKERASVFRVVDTPIRWGIGAPRSYTGPDAMPTAGTNSRRYHPLERKAGTPYFRPERDEYSGDDDDDIQVQRQPQKGAVGRALPGPSAMPPPAGGDRMKSWVKNALPAPFVGHAGTSKPSAGARVVTGVDPSSLAAPKAHAVYVQFVDSQVRQSRRV